MSSLDAFNEILQRDEPLAPYTWLRLGGPAQYLVTPRSVEELKQFVTVCHEEQIPIHILGGGSNLLVKDEGVSGAVIRLTSPVFAEVHIEGNKVRAGSGALLSRVISETVRAGLSGFENLAGIPGTIGGALCGNSGGRQGEISQLVTSVTGLTSLGEVVVRSQDELSFDYRQSNLNELLILEGEFELRSDDPEAISQKLKMNWIAKKAVQPLSSQSAGCIFKNPRGQRAGMLIEQAGLKGTRIGGAEISERHANFIVTYPGAKSSDVLRLIDLVRSKISEQFGVHLEPEIKIW
ncbi:MULTISPECIES: UDP-N-acetylmuramate dehydrogenase [unclassified Schlesneria]|uniref:UDP-N-acetylmuramate dehydrogenase n=1 Tax=unclassified Schlesneria TaxID=2762017 RepID=UPI002F09FF1D